MIQGASGCERAGVCAYASGYARKRRLNQGRCMLRGMLLGGGMGCDVLAGLTIATELSWKQIRRLSKSKK